MTEIPHTLDAILVSQHLVRGSMVVDCSCQAGHLACASWCRSTWCVVDDGGLFLSGWASGMRFLVLQHLVRGLSDAVLAC